MRKIIFTFAIASLMATGAVYAADHSTPGTPGDKNCVGQTTAYLAQAGQSLGAPGIGNIASLAGLSVQEVKAVIQAFCAAP